MTIEYKPLKYNSDRASSWRIKLMFAPSEEIGEKEKIKKKRNIYLVKIRWSRGEIKE